MDKDVVRKLLEDLAKGAISVDSVMERLKHLPFEDIGLASIDHHRSLRKGLSEVIFGQGKEAADIIAIMDAMVQQDENIMVTRLSPEKAQEVLKKYPASLYSKTAKVLTLSQKPIKRTGRGIILVMCAGTSDIPVAEEAVATARFMGNEVETVYDVGVSGIHRLLGHQECLAKARIIIVVAGMEGALPSVVGGLVDKPVIAVPTSVGYGASFGGITALLGMLNSCAAGVTVVNIDNGFGAGYAACVMNKND